MTLRELEVECIRYVAEDAETGLTAETYNSFKSKDVYKDYFNNVLPSINRALQRVSSRNKIPYITFELEITKDNINNLTKEYLLNVCNSQLNKKLDIKSIYSVSLFFKGEYKPIYFSYVNNKLTLKNSFIRNTKIYINFVPKIKTFTRLDEEDQTIENYERLDTSVNLKDYGIDDDILFNVVVNLVKADLFAFDNPSLAQNNRSLGESYLNDVDISDSILPDQDYVNTDCSIMRF